MLAAGSSAQTLAEESRPDVNWDQIEAWALGDALTIQLGSGKAEAKPDKPENADPKVMATPEPAAPKVEAPKPESLLEPRATIPPLKSTSRRADPRAIAELRASILQRAATRLTRLEADRQYDQAFDLAYRVENYFKAMEFVMKMLADKRWSHRDTEIWAAGKMWEIGLLSGQMQSNTLEVHFKNWKERALKAVEEGRFVRGDIPHNAEQIRQREMLYRSWSQGLSEDLKKLEAAGDEHPKPLWNLAIRFSDEYRPYWPMRCMSALVKLREWHPEFEQVKSGDVQVRLAKLLWEHFWMPREAAEEAERAMEKHPKHPVVLDGDLCWIAAEGNRQLGFEQKTNREALEYFKQAKFWYETYQKKYGNGQHNRTQGQEPKTECQRRIEDTNKNIEIRQIRNK